MENYTTIDHEKRKRLDLSVNEYVIADYISNLASNKKSKIGGWCYASKQTMADEFGIAKKNIIAIIARLISKELIEKDEATKFLRPKQAWTGYERLPLVTKGNRQLRKDTATGYETLPPKNQNHAQSGYETLPNNRQEELQDILGTFNSVFLSRYKAINTIEKNASYWLGIYSLAEIKEAIAVAKKDDYWQDKLTPEMLFRKSDRQGNPCDRIGDILRNAEKPVEFKVIGGAK